MHGYVAPADYALYKACSKLLGCVLRHGSNPNGPTPSNTDASLSAKCCFALLAQRGEFAEGLVPGDLFNALTIPGARAWAEPWRKGPSGNL